MWNQNLMGVIGGAAAVAILVGVAAVVSATSDARGGKSHRQCHREATSLKHNPNDESDSWGYNNYMSRCMYGTDEQTAREFETWKARGKNGSERQVARGREVERQLARRRDREHARYEQSRRRELQEQAAEARRALARAQPQYRQQAAPMHDYCRDLAVLRAHNWRDEEDIAMANQFHRACMRGFIPGIDR